ncbi:LysR substrate-binding domain-containing protein [Tabrizicola sp.]|uniref:LysR family transcriptional regulator n=1 Tax=Tabrizicola sp. TaxID=2005166 RepID=UPI002634305A|nr:LysR substrate-binding domain-containing protein [Tabrizicola sp.]MDM7932356.1 LysR substrate-binding domain-containing protein [Tabrizicola sp.]
MNLPQSLLSRGIKLSHLQILAAFAETGQIGAAAVQVGIAQPAASRLLSEVEVMLGLPVRQRSGRGVILTEAGRSLADRAARVLQELAEAAREVAEIAGGGVGRVKIGAVTAPALDIVLPTLRQARTSHPAIACDVVVAGSDVLCGQLASGALDMAIGRVPPTVDPALFEAVVIAPEPVALVVRRGHPLAEAPPRDAMALFAHDWVMPGEDSPLAQAVLARLAELGLPRPVQHLSTSSFLLTLAALQQADAVAPMAKAVADEFASGPAAPFVQIALDLSIAVAPFSLLTRKAARLTAAAETVLSLIRLRLGGFGADWEQVSDKLLPQSGRTNC